MTARKPKRRIWLKLAAGLLFAVVSYGAAYYAAVVPRGVFWIGNTAGAGREIVGSEIVAEYPVTASPIVNQRLGSFFLPANQVDRMLRAETWRPAEIPDVDL